MASDQDERAGEEAARAGMRSPADQPRRATLKDVAQAVGVHVSTVSRALNPQTRHLITDEIADRIAQESRRLDYRPNPAAYSLRTRRTRTIGVVVPDITNAIFPPIIRGVEDALVAQGYATLIVNTDGRVDREVASLDALSARGVDGLVVASVEREDAALSALARQGAAVVTVNRRLDDAAVSSVVNDDAAGVRLMLTHLIGLGHRRIASIGGAQNLSTGKLRHEAFLRDAAAMGLDVGASRLAFTQTFNETNGARCMDELLDGGGDFTAVLCANDRVAIGAIAAARARGLACPRDMSVTGFNDMPMVDRIDPPLTTVRVDHYRVGRAAADLLLARIAGDPSAQTPQHIVLPVEAIVRGSTAPPRD